VLTLIGQVYRVPSYAQKSIESICKNASEPFNLVVCDNKSLNSDKIIKIVLELFEKYKNVIPNAKLLAFEENTKGWCLRKTYEDFPPNNSEDFFMYSDLDLIVPDGLDWIKEVKNLNYTTLLSQSIYLNN